MQVVREPASGAASAMSIRQVCNFCSCWNDRWSSPISGLPESIVGGPWKGGTESAARETEKRSAELFA
jgi:hypothetical protein